MAVGIDSMALRHGIALVGAYVVYLGLLWAWCRWLISRDGGTLDIGDPGFDLPSPASDGARSADSPVFRSGGGGDFGGGGADGSSMRPTLLAKPSQQPLTPEARP